MLPTHLSYVTYLYVVCHTQISYFTYLYIMSRTRTLYVTYSYIILHVVCTKLVFIH